MTVRVTVVITVAMNLKASWLGSLASHWQLEVEASRPGPGAGGHVPTSSQPPESVQVPVTLLAGYTSNLKLNNLKSICASRQ